MGNTCRLLPVALPLAVGREGSHVGLCRVVPHICLGQTVPGLIAWAHSIPTDVNTPMYVFQYMRGQCCTLSRNWVAPEHDSVADAHQPPEHAHAALVSSPNGQQHDDRILQLRAQAQLETEQLQ